MLKIMCDRTLPTMCAKRDCKAWEEEEEQEKGETTHTKNQWYIWSVADACLCAPDENNLGRWKQEDEEVNEEGRGKKMHIYSDAKVEHQIHKVWEGKRLGRQPYTVVMRTVWTDALKFSTNSRDGSFLFLTSQTVFLSDVRRQVASEVP